MESKGNPKKKRYLRWPWNVLVYILLVVLLRVFAIPFILLIMWWNRNSSLTVRRRGTVSSVPGGDLPG